MKGLAVAVNIPSIRTALTPRLQRLYDYVIEENFSIDERQLLNLALIAHNTAERLRGKTGSAPGDHQKPTRTASRAARKKMSDGQKRRWAKEKETPGSAPAPQGEAEQPAPTAIGKKHNRKRQPAPEIARSAGGGN